MKMNEVIKINVFVPYAINIQETSNQNVIYMFKEE